MVRVGGQKFHMMTTARNYATRTMVLKSHMEENISLLRDNYNNDDDDDNNNNNINNNNNVYLKVIFYLHLNIMDTLSGGSGEWRGGGGGQLWQHCFASLLRRG